MDVRYYKTRLNGLIVTWACTSKCSLENSLREFYGKNIDAIKRIEISGAEARKSETTDSHFKIWLKQERDKYCAYQFGEVVSRKT